MRFPGATHLVVLARFQGTRLRDWIEPKLEGWLGLEINREKTRVVNLQEEGASLDFLGFTFRYDEDLKGRGWRYLRSCLEITLPDIRISGDGFRSSILHGTDLCGD